VIDTFIRGDITWCSEVNHVLRQGLFKRNEYSNIDLIEMNLRSTWSLKYFNPGLKNLFTNNPLRGIIILGLLTGDLPNEVKIVVYK
jgi:hypothetical protein